MSGGNRQAGMRPTPDNTETIKAAIREIPDFPQKGVIFKDITNILNNRRVFKTVIDDFARRYRRERIDQIVGIEARGLIFGAALAYVVDCGFIPVRKSGKLPWQTFREEYALEYGTATIEMHRDAIKEGERVLIVDDLLATGGTACATVNLTRSAGADVIGAAFLIELSEFKGRDKIPVPVLSLVTY